MLSTKEQVIRTMHGALEKKDFFPGEVCPIYFLEEVYTLKKQAYSPQGEVCPLSPEPGR